MRIFIGGDITPTKTTVPAFEAGDLKALFGGIGELMATGDICFANLECALTESDTPIRKCGPNLRGKPSYAKVLADLGVDVVGLSNNHTFDYGRPGLRDTIAALEAHGLPYTGVGRSERDARKPLFTEVCGKRVAWVCVCEHEYCYALPDREGAWAFDPFETMEDITAAKAAADYVIVIYHGGKEQSRYPSPRLRKACRAMIRAGADFVTCQHSHCVGAHEEYQGGNIVYGQGNFNFVGLVNHPHWNNGMLLQLDIDDEGGTKLTFHSLCVTETGVDLSEGEEKERELREFAERNRILADEEKWLAEWRAFCESVKTGYRRAVANAFPEGPDGPVAEVFPHYLDCEAHTDVWREIFPTWHGSGTNETNPQTK